MAGVVIFTALARAPADLIGNNVVRIIVKVVILAFFIMLEFCVWINATLPWLERKFPNRPRVCKKNLEACLKILLQYNFCHRYFRISTYIG